MEEYSINIVDDCYNDIIRIADYISTHFFDEDLANKIAFEIYAGIKKLSLIGPMLGFSDNEILASKGIRDYTIKSYVVYYVIDEKNKIVNVLRVRHELQDVNKFFGVQ